MNLRDVFLRVRALAAPRRVENELDEELAFHIERETLKHITDGLSPEDARSRALARFGPVPLAADQCRDARGIAFVDALARDILYAFRTFRRAPLAALTIVATVALGLGLVAAVFEVYSTFLLRADAVRSPGELFAVKLERWTGPDSDEDVPFTRSDYDAMRRETSVFTDAVAMLDNSVTRFEGRPARSALVTGNTESLLLALAAAAGGLVVSRLFLEGALHAAITTMPPDLAEPASLMNLDAPSSDWRVLVFLVAGAVVSTVFFGLAPALQAARLDLVPTMRGEVTRVFIRAGRGMP